MSPAALATVAFLALVAALGGAAWAAVQHRRIEVLARSLTSAKWDLITLRAELRALRQQLDGEWSGAPEVPAQQSRSERMGAPDAPAARPAGALGNPGADGEPESRTSGSHPRVPAGPTAAWRRDRARTAATKHRRRRPS